MDAFTNTIIVAGEALQIHLAIQSFNQISEITSKLDQCISDAAKQVFESDENESPCLELEQELSKKTFELRLYSALTLFFTGLIAKSLYEGCGR